MTRTGSCDESPIQQATRQPWFCRHRSIVNDNKDKDLHEDNNPLGKQQYAGNLDV